jgi:hypothetical protein
MPHANPLKTDLFNANAGRGLAAAGATAAGDQPPAQFLMS